MEIDSLVFFVLSLLGVTPPRYHITLLRALIRLCLVIVRIMGRTLFCWFVGCLELINF